MSDLIQIITEAKDFPKVRFQISSKFVLFCFFVFSFISQPLQIQQVLRDIATGLKNRGFFNDSNWSHELVNVFKAIEENMVIDDSVNEHEISNSFVVSNGSLSFY